MTAAARSTGAGDRASTSQPGLDAADDFVRSHPGVVKAARAGWVAKGAVYGLTGVLALLIAVQPGPTSRTGPDQEASQTGAIANIAGKPAGAVLLAVLAAGLILYAAWRAVTIVLPARNDLKTWATRVGYVISLVTYLALAWTTISIIRGASASGANGQTEDSRVERFTASLMEHSGGRWLVGLLGVALVIVGVAFLSRTWTADFRTQLIPAGVGPLAYRHIVALGRIGWAGRGLMLGVIGFFLVQSARHVNPDEAQGLDGSLRRLSAGAPGRALVLVVAVCLVAYGLFCVVSAPRQRLTGADG